MVLGHASFDSTKQHLEEILHEVDSGFTQLPDFQRGWVWDDDHIKSLVASICTGYPIGAVMMLEVGESGAVFKPRRVEGTKSELDDIVPDRLILDGQQRLTSLFLALFNENPVPTKDARNKRIDRHYYIDINLAVGLESDVEEAIVSVPAERQVRTFRNEMMLDVSSQELEFEHELFPADCVFKSTEWRREYSKYWNYEKEKLQLFDQFEEEVLKQFSRYQVPVIQLGRNTAKEAVCLVFEKVNTGGVPLTVFELITATFASENFQLRDDWRDREADLKRDFRVLRNVRADDFLQVISLLDSMSRRIVAIENGETVDRAPGITCKRRDLLRLNVADYKTWADSVTDGFKRAARFLHRQKIFTERDLPYQSQLVPLAAIFAELGQESESEGNQRKIARWFWCGIMGELYGSAVESRFARDLPDVVQLVRADYEPDTVRDSNFAIARLQTLRTRNSAAYKGIHALLMREGCLDFRTGETVEAQQYFDEAIDIHHIFPQKWCIENGIEPAVYNSVVNKTAISARTNRQIGGKAPSDYLAGLRVSSSIGEDRQASILDSHLISAGSLKSDEFDAFLAERTDRLATLIEGATGKNIDRPKLLEMTIDDAEDFEEDLETWEDADVVSGIG